MAGNRWSSVENAIEEKQLCGCAKIINLIEDSQRPNLNDAFWRWFGSSKVVDKDGKPLVVYHGTAVDFDTFDNSKTGTNDRGGLRGERR